MNDLFSMRYPSLAADKKEDVLRLIRTLNVGPVTCFQLIMRFGTASAALDALPDLSIRGGRRNPLKACPKADALREMEAAEEFGARMIMYGEPDYPTLLHTISDPPPLITVIGNPHLWQRMEGIAVVGSRNASAGGCQLATRISKELGAGNILVVSGLARGIDAAAHKGALGSGTVAVIAGGIDNVYPPEHRILYDQIREKGAIISEQPFGAIPFSGSFPGRNRIIAGMTLGTLIVEAAPKSGSLITARLALEYDREVFAVPGSPLDPRSRGCNELIRQGAVMAESAGDILRVLTNVRRPGAGEMKPPSYEAIAEGSMEATEEVRRQILEKLSVTPVSVDELIEQCHISPATAMAAVLELELAGRVLRAPGNRVSLVATLEQEIAS